MYLKLSKSATVVQQVLSDKRMQRVEFDDEDVAITRDVVSAWLSDKPDLPIVADSAETVDTLCKQAIAWLNDLKRRKFVSLSRSQNALAVGFIIGDLIVFHMALEQLLVSAGVVEQVGKVGSTDDA